MTDSLAGLRLAIGARPPAHFGMGSVAGPTTAGTGAETNSFGVVTDSQTQRKFYVGHASTMPAAAILDPALTVGLPPLPTAATGVDALTHASSPSCRCAPIPGRTASR